ncbi:MAG: hypothetical protein AAFX90_10100 [Pseudomonadota bacterium]
MIRVSLIALIALSACTASIPVPDDTPGTVHQFNGETVTIRGAFERDRLETEAATPTSAMVAQAKGVCPGAQYLSATPDSVTAYYTTFLFLFRC